MTLTFAQTMTVVRAFLQEYAEYPGISLWGRDKPTVELLPPGGKPNLLHWVETIAHMRSFSISASWDFLPSDTRQLALDKQCPSGVSEPR